MQKRTKDEMDEYVEGYRACYEQFIKYIEQAEKKMKVMIAMVEATLKSESEDS